jgi:hypothetical protein
MGVRMAYTGGNCFSEKFRFLQPRYNAPDPKLQVGQARFWDDRLHEQARQPSCLVRDSPGAWQLIATPSARGDAARPPRAASNPARPPRAGSTPARPPRRVATQRDPLGAASTRRAPRHVVTHRDPLGAWATQRDPLGREHQSRLTRPRAPSATPSASSTQRDSLVATQRDSIGAWATQRGLPRRASRLG